MRFVSPSPVEAQEDQVARQWGDQTLTHFEDQLLSLLVRAMREAARLGCAEFSPEAALLGLFRCPVGKEICRGLADAEVTERSRELLERCLRRSADGGFDSEDLPFSPSLRHLLESVEAERARLNHEEAQARRSRMACCKAPAAGGAPGAGAHLAAVPRDLGGASGAGPEASAAAASGAAVPGRLLRQGRGAGGGLAGGALQRATADRRRPFFGHVPLRFGRSKGILWPETC